MDENEPKGATIHDMWITNYADCQSFLLLRLRQWRGMIMMRTTTAMKSQVLVLIINLMEKSTGYLLSIHESASRKLNNSYLAIWKMRQFRHDQKQILEDIFFWGNIGNITKWGFWWQAKVWSKFKSPGEQYNNGWLRWIITFGEPFKFGSSPMTFASFTKGSLSQFDYDYFKTMVLYWSLPYKATMKE